MRLEILAKISEAIGEPVKGEEVFDYVYGVLHDKEYCTKYFEFLKIEYPRIPYPKNKAEYEHFVKIGAQLRRLHLMDETLNLPLIATFDVAGSNQIEFVKYDNGKVWIKKRVGRRLDFDDVNWYLRICATIWAELEIRGER